MSPHDHLTRPTPRRANTLEGGGNLSLISTTTTSTSSSTPLFPQLTQTQFTRLDRIINALDQGAKTWSEFNKVKDQLEQQQLQQQPAGEEEDEEDEEDLYGISLKLVLQDGATWKEKWNRIVESQQQTPSPTVGALDILRARIDKMTTSSQQNKDDSRINSNRPRSTPPFRTSSSSTKPTTTTPKPLPPSPSTANILPRDFLVRRSKDRQNGHQSNRRNSSSSDDQYVGVPSLQDLALARQTERLRRREQQQQQQQQRQEETEEEEEEEFYRQQSTPQAPPPPSASIPTRPLPPPIQSTPTRPFSTTAAVTKHPLLERRLQELGLSSSSPNHHPSIPLPPPPPAALEATTKSSSKFLRLEELESKALQFRQLHLLSIHFDHWSQLSRFSKSRLESVRLARDQWLLRCSLLDWISLTRKQLHLRSLLEEEWNSIEREERREERIKREWFGRLRNSFREREKVKLEVQMRIFKKEKEKELKHARNLVFVRSKEVLLKTTLQKWRLKSLESLAFKFRLRFLPLYHLRIWSRQLENRLDHVETLKGVAEEVFNQKEFETGKKFLGVWKEKTRLNLQEREYGIRLRDRLIRGVIEKWKSKTRDKIHERELEDLSIVTHNRSLAIRSLSTWKIRTSNLSQLSSIASQTFSLNLSNRSFKLWKLKTKASKFYTSKSQQLVKNTLENWIERFDFIELDLNGTLLNKISTSNRLKLLSKSLNQWNSRTRDIKHISFKAIELDNSRIEKLSLEKWKTRYKRVELEHEKSRVVYEFFKQRSSLKKWRDLFQQKKRNKWEEDQKRKRKSEVLQFWVKRTKQSREDKRLIEIVQKKIRRITLSTSVTVWKDQVIIRKELERESTILYESTLAQSSFRKWITRTVEFSDQLNKADDYRSIKLEELRDQFFQKWFQSTRRSISLKQRISDYTTDKRKKILEDGFGIWREKRLKKFENEVRNRIEKGTRRNVFEKWRRESKILTALTSYRKNLIRKSFNNWKKWTPSTVLVAQAVQHDSQCLIRCGIQRWSLKTSYRQAFRNTSGRLSAPRSSTSFPSPSSRSATSSPTSTSSPSLVRKRSSIILSTSSPSPSPLSIDSPSFRPSSQQSVMTTAPSSLLVNHSPASLPRDSGYRTTPTFNSRSAFSSSSSQKNAAITGHRPRLSAEYKAPLRVPPPPPSSARLRTTTSSRRRNSIVSLGTRSAPARVFESDDDSTQEEDGDGDEEVERGIARSEGGGEEDEGRRKRDVRKGYEALRERLRAAR